MNTGPIFYPQGLSVNTYTYYVTQSIESCGASEATEVTLTINPVPAAPTVNNEQVCEGTVIPNLTVTGTNLAWYANQNLTQIINSGSTFATGETGPGVYNYYVPSLSGPVKVKQLLLP